MQPDHEYARAGEVVLARRALYAHATLFVIVNVALIAIDQTTPRGPWFIWPLIIWGIGLMIMCSASREWRRTTRRRLARYAGTSGHTPFRR